LPETRPWTLSIYEARNFDGVSSGDRADETTDESGRARELTERVKILLAQSGKFADEGRTVTVGIDGDCS